MEIAGSADPTLLEAGRRGMSMCLDSKPSDRVTIVADEACRVIGAAFLAAAEQIGCETRAFVVERYMKRPLTRFPEQILESMASSTVTVLAMIPQPGEFRARSQIIEMVPERKLRHAHLVAVSPEALRRGMRADYRAIDVLQDRIVSIFTEAGAAHAFSPNGTDLKVTFTPEHRWVKSNGLIFPGNWQNLPSGQVYSCPGSVDGTYVADRSIGDWFEQKYPDLSIHPVTLDLTDGRLRSVRCQNGRLSRELTLFTRSAENAERVGEVGFGTNPFLEFIKGQSVNNEDVPGCHLALGNPISHKTGAKWTAKTRVALVGSGMTVVAGKRTIMVDGSFAPDLFEGLPSLIEAV